MNRLLVVTAVAGMVAALGAAATLGLAQPVESQLFGDGSQSTGGGWINFPQRYPLSSSTVTLVQFPRRSDGSCIVRFRVVAPVPAGGPATEGREIAYNPRTCQAKMERGIPPAYAIATQQAAYDPATVDHRSAKP